MNLIALCTAALIIFSTAFFVDTKKTVSVTADIQTPIYSSDVGEKRKTDNIKYGNDQFLETYEVSLHNGGKKNFSVDSGESYLFTDDDSPFKLSKHQKVTLSFDINLSSDYSDKNNGEPVIVGYTLSGQSKEIYSGKTGVHTLSLEFVAPEDGEYLFYLGNTSVGIQNYNSVSITKE